jgi:hypothetical protein
MRLAVRRLATTLSLAPLLVLFAASCSDSGDGGNPFAPDVAPQLDIHDAARSGGTPGFYFLTPIAPALPSYPGTFAADRSPAVEICEWSGSACATPLVARYTLSEGTGGSTIQLDAAAESYRVDWPMAGVAAGKVYRIRVLDGIWELGHADAKRPAAGDTPASLKAQGLVPLGNAGKLAIRFRIEQNSAPVVAITAPADQAVVTAGSPVTFTATATDAEEGDLASQIVWRSSQVETPLGTGASLTTTLASGRHTISASVTDAMGRTTTTAIEIVASIISAPTSLSVPFGGTASLPISLSEPAREGGLTLTVSSGTPGTVAVTTTTVTIPAGSQSANATLRGLAPGSATVTVSNPDFGSATTPVTVTAQLNIVQSSVTFARGRSADITIELKSGGNDVAAPAGGLVVHLAATDPGCAAVEDVTIPEGLVSTRATLTHGDTTATPCATRVTASAPSVAGVTGDVVDVNVGAAPTLSLAATRVGAGLQTSVTLNLGAPAPAGGLTVTLASADPAVLRVSEDAATAGSATTSFTIAAGQTSHTVYLHGMEGKRGAVGVTASASGYSSGTATQTVAPIALEITGLNTSITTLSANDEFYVRVGVVNAATTGIAAYQNVRAGAGALTVSVANADATVGQLVRTGGAAQSATVQIPAGAGQSPTTVAAGGVAFDPTGGGTTTIAVSAPGAAPIAASSQGVSVSAPAISMAATRVGAGLQTSVTLSLGAPAPAGGLQLSLASSDPAVLRLSDGASVEGVGSLTFTIAAGQSSHTIYLHGMEGRSGSATVTASAAGYTPASVMQTVAPPTLDIAGLGSSATTLSANDEFYVRVGVLNAAGTGITAYQNVRAGAAPLVVTVTNGSAAVAQLVQTGGAAQTVTVQIPAGAGQSPTTVAAGGVAFDATGAGTTTVSVSAPGVTPIGASSQSVSVSAPSISLGATRVGAGLQSSATISLGAPAPAGGLAVAVSSADASVLRLAATDDDAGTGSLTVTIAAGQSSRTIYLMGVPGRTGSVTTTVSAPGYAGGSATHVVAPITLDLASLGSSTTTLSANDEFYARVGVLNAAGTGIAAYQNVHPGAGPLVVSLANGNAGVGQLVRTGGAAQTATVQIPEGASQSPTTVAAGGVAFDPIGAGTTTVTASAPGATPIAASSQSISVSAPAISIASTRVGAGLQTSVSITLGAPAPAGGLEVAVASSSPTVLQLAASAGATVGSGTTTLTVAAGQSSATLYLRGVAGQAGTATVTAVAPGYTNGTASQTVAAPMLDFASLSSTIGASAASDAFYVRVGVVNAAGTGISAYQNVQSGAGPLVVTLANGNAAVAQLVRTAGAAQSVTVQIPEGASQ